MNVAIASSNHSEIENMVGKNMVLVSFISFASFLLCFSHAVPGEESNLQTYLVFVEKPEGIDSLEGSEDLDSYYQQFLPTTTATSDDDSPRMVHSYYHVVTGFAARLTPAEVESMKEKQGFLSARPDRILHLQTTYTPKFLGLQRNSGFWNASGYGKGVVVGVLDTGVTPNHPSFSDQGMPPPPAKWKGKCEPKEFCNNKVIGARNLAAKGESVEDEEGHGTHTASTAAGSAVSGANALGQGFGTAVGMAPMAHLAIYKVCGEKGCTDGAIMAAFDAAVDDGVDVLSVSLGGDSAPFFDDGIAIAAFGAIKKGVFVSCAAGNDGPTTSSLSNEAPWILTVGASTVDRQIKSTVLLGNKKEIDGQTLFQPKDFDSSKMLPLVYAGSSHNSSSMYCAPGSLANADIHVKGKVVVCESGGKIKRIDKGIEVRNNGGAAMILINSAASGFTTLADAHELPASHVSYEAGMLIKAYINSTAYPTATIVFKGTMFSDQENAPQVASFSSRGPSKASPGIMKPDVIGPGVSTLAAWPTLLEEDSISSSPETKFNMISGTSMSCPHLSGIAALLRGSHPDWSPAVIKSAMMTTAHLTQFRSNKAISDEQCSPADLFQMGSGHVNPVGANDPGLVYDIQPDDYIPYLCGLGYSDVLVTTIVQQKVQCSSNQSIPEAQLNYPSFVLTLGSQPETYTRTVTNVGKANSVYRVEVQVATETVAVEVSPGEIAFSRLNEKANYSVTFSLRNGTTTSGKFVQGSLIWVADGYRVRSPFGITLK